MLPSMSSLHGDWMFFCDAHMSGSEHIQLPAEIPINEARIRHDIRASLAISKGMCQALEMSLDELNSASAIEVLEERLDCVEKIEKDCRFCLSRILRSLIQLDSTVEAVVSHSPSVVASDVKDVVR